MQDDAGGALAALAHVLERMVARNDRISPDPSAASAAEVKGLEAFRGVRPPSISIGKYLERIHRYTGCSPSCFVVAFVYIDRAAHRTPGSLVVSLNVHRLILTSVLIASKFLDDLHHNNAFFSRVGGVTNVDLNRLELELLFLLEFDVAVNFRIFESYCLHLEKEMLWTGANIKICRTISDFIDGEMGKLTDGTQESTPTSPPLHYID